MTKSEIRDKQVCKQQGSTLNKRQSVTACGYWSSFVEYIAVKKNAKNVEGKMNRCGECQNREKRMVWFEHHKSTRVSSVRYRVR